MKISNVGVTNIPSSTQQQSEVSAAGSQSSPPTGASTETSTYTPSSALLNLVNLVNQQPDVRADRVQAAMQRLQQGDYLTSDAADQTAVAMLGAAD